jgi:hypothetical protein
MKFETVVRSRENESLLFVDELFVSRGRCNAFRCARTHDRRRRLYGLNRILAPASPKRALFVRSNAAAKKGVVYDRWGRLDNIVAVGFRNDTKLSFFYSECFTDSGMTTGRPGILLARIVSRRACRRWHSFCNYDLPELTTRMTKRTRNA